jgi:hypothetical protein
MIQCTPYSLKKYLLLLVVLLLLLVLVLVLVIRGGQLVTTERACGIMMKPLEDAMLVEDVGVGYGPQR